MLTEEVGGKLGNYVYRLIDPRNGETFYVGKGTGNRVLDHARDSLKSFDEVSDAVDPKIFRIRSIIGAGLEVQHVIHRHQLPANAVFHVEAALIDAYPGLTNKNRGHGSGEFGLMHLTQIINLYEIEELNLKVVNHLLLINVNRSSDDLDREGYYSKVRFAWKLNVEKARKVDFVCAVVRGVIRGVYVAENWMPANAANFPEFKHLMDGNSSSKRWGFVGKAAPEADRERYMNKRLPDRVRHIQNPIRYVSASSIKP